MAARTFDRFPCLPQELQDMVWKQAAASRPREFGKPAAHFFTLFNVSEDDVSSVEQLVGGHHSCHRLAEPRHTLSPRGDLSAYLIDGGVWTACKNSHRAMMKRYEVVEQRALMAQYSPDISGNIGEWMKWRRVVEAASVTRYMHSTGQGDRFFTVCQASDLIVLQPMDWMTLDVRKLSWDYAAMFGGHNNGSWVKHIAFEFDPSWAMNIDPYHPPASGPYRAILDALQQAAGPDGFPAHNIWLIDYSIRRRTASDPAGRVRPDQPRAVFYGNGCRFTEVRFADPEWSLVSFRRVESFASDVIDAALVQDESKEFSGEPSPAYFSILACEMLDE